MQHVLQHALEEATAKLPAILLQNLISKKLREQGIQPPKGLPAKMAEHFLAGNREPFKYDGRKLPKNVKLTFKRWTHHLALAGGATTMTATVSARTEGLSWVPEKVAAGLCLRENEAITNLNGPRTKYALDANNAAITQVLR